MRHVNRHEAPASRAFTLVETLVVIGIIVVLLGVLIVGLATASSRAAMARTVVLLNSMEQATAQFRQDMGYLPPVLDAGRNLLAPPASGNTNALQDWFSVTSPAEFLVGYGPEATDGNNGVGIRHPGSDGVWRSTAGGGTGLLADRLPVDTGKVYGPYLQLEDDQLLGTIDGGGVVRVPTDAGYDLTDPNQSATILDYWGRPIRYYQRHPDRSTQPGPSMDMGNVFALRPFTIDDGATATGVADSAGSTATTFTLKGAEFAFFSPGPDRSFDATLRYDDATLVNEDNIVESGQ